MKDYNITFKIRNNYLLQAMKSNGISTAAELSRLADVDQFIIGKFLNLLEIPFQKYRGRNNGKMFVSSRWRTPVLKIASALDCLPEDLFPHQHLTQALGSNVAETELSIEDIGTLLIGEAKNPELECAENEARSKLNCAVEKTLSLLKPKEEKILRMRFGIGDEKDYTLDEAGQHFNMSKERLRQIEAKALRKLRHPSLGIYLKPFTGKGIEKESLGAGST